MVFPPDKYGLVTIHYLGTYKADKILLLVLMDAESSYIDFDDQQLLTRDAHKVV